MNNEFSINNKKEPQIIAAEKDYLVVYKPAGMHTSPLANSTDNTMFKWCVSQYPEIADIAVSEALPDNDLNDEDANKKPLEGGMLHRLDFDTHGLLLIARTQLGKDVILNQQREGMFIKGYCALTAEKQTKLSGFPDEKPIIPFWIYRDKYRIGDSVGLKCAFKPYGPGRKEVRPVQTSISPAQISKEEVDIAYDGNRPYVTDIVGAKLLSPNGEQIIFEHVLPRQDSPGLAFFRLKIIRGFRHQIRCQLAWMGRPILNDMLYGGISYGNGLLALRAYSVTFTDPSSGKEMTYSIPLLELGDI